MPKLTAMMIIRNEADRYLKRCLESMLNFVDAIIILDDASEDNTPDICLRYPEVKLYRQNQSTFLINEAELRQKLWHYTLTDNPEWILAIDADEFFEDSAIKEFPYLLKQKDFNAIGFRLFDCWGSEDFYRIDGLWNPWLRGFSIYLVKYVPQLGSTWPPLKFHCGRIPLAYRKLVSYESCIRIKHLGWANSLDIAAKYQRAIRQDPSSKYMDSDHYESILWLPERINLQKWIEHLSI